MGKQVKAVENMDQSSTPSVFSHLEHLEDPRLDRRKLHELRDTLVITICAAICGANSWTKGFKRIVFVR